MYFININDDENRKSLEKIFLVNHALLHDDDEKIIKDLLQTEGDINYTSTDSPYKFPDLLQTAHCDSLFDLLLENGVDFTAKDKNGRTTVHRIIEKQCNIDNLPLNRSFQNWHIEKILAAHVKFNNFSNPCDNNGLSHFHVACMTNNVEAVGFFLKNGIDVNQSVKAHSPIFPLDTPLHLAVKYTCPDVVELLMNKVNIYSKNAAKLSPLHLIIERAIENCNITEKNRFVTTRNIFLKYAIDNLIHNVESSDNFGFNKLHAACLLQDQIAIETAVKQVINVNKAVNLNDLVCPGYTALHFLAFANVKLFLLLLVKGANIEMKNAMDVTPLDLCLQNYSAQEIYSILSSKMEWKSVILSDKKTKLVDVISALDTVDTFKTFLDKTKLTPSSFVPLDSPIWPGYTLLHLTVIFAKKVSDSRFNFVEQSDDIEIVSECLNRGADITAIDAKGSTALHLAFYTKKRLVTNYLLDHHNKKINPVDKNKLSHFHIACAANHQKAVEDFLSIGVKINAAVSTTLNWYTNLKMPLSQISQITKFKFIHYSIPARSTSLHINIASFNYKITEKLLENGADVNAKEVNGFTPIHRLLSRGYFECENIANLLLNSKQLKNITSDCGLSHLHVACYFGHSDAVEKLLKNGADPNAVVNYNYYMGLKDYDEFFYKRKNYRKTVNFLSDYDGYTPIDFLWYKYYDKKEFDRKSFCKITCMLLERNVKVTAKNFKGNSLLQYLLQKIDKKDNDFSYEVLKKNDALQARLKEEFGFTKLHLACYIADVKLVENLLKNGDNVNAKVYLCSPVLQKFTPLHCAIKEAIENIYDKKCVHQTTKIVRLLTENGADILATDNNNNTPFHIIKNLNNENFSKMSKIFSFFANVFANVKNFNVNPVNKQGLSLFHIACITQNKLAIAKFILSDSVDVNKAVNSDSDFCPSSSPLHLVLKYYQLSDSYSSRSAESKENILQILDVLIKNGANVNAVDNLGETPLFIIIKMKQLRLILIEKFIRYNANVNATNLNGNTPFESLLIQGDANWEEIQIFLEAGCHFNMYNPVSQEGYMPEIFLHQQTFETQSEDFTKVGIWQKILNYPKIIELNDLGRSAIHNIVCTKNSGDGTTNSYQDEYVRKGIFKTKRLVPRSTTYGEFCAGVINELSMRGCDIDYQDNEGKTALHSAVAFNNTIAISVLFEKGVDINIVDKTGKTAFAYFNETHENFVDVSFLVLKHIYKMQLCGLHVNEQNLKFKAEALNRIENFKEPSGFREELEKAKHIKIGTTSLTLYEFLMSNNTNIVYTNLKSEERRKLEQFFESISEHRFCEIDCLIMLKYRQSIEKIKLLNIALESFDFLAKCQVPDLCCRIIFKYLKNGDLKRLINSVE